jgi:hypothetical protein
MLVNGQNCLLIEGVLNKLIKYRSIKCFEVRITNIRYNNYHHQVTSNYGGGLYDFEMYIGNKDIFLILVYYKDYIRMRGRVQLNERIKTIMTMLGVSTINWEAKVRIYGDEN